MVKSVRDDYPFHTFFLFPCKTPKQKKKLNDIPIYPSRLYLLDIIIIVGI